MKKTTVTLLSKAKQSKAKQSHNCLLNNDYLKFLFQKYFFNLVKTFLTLIKFNFISLLKKNFSFIINEFKLKIIIVLSTLKNSLTFVNFQRFRIEIFVYLNTIYKIY